VTHHSVLPHETNSLATPLSHAKAGKNSSEGRGADSNFHAAREAKHPSARPVHPTKGSPPPPRSPWELTLGVSPSRLRKLSRGEFTHRVPRIAFVLQGIVTATHAVQIGVNRVVHRPFCHHAN